jgi:hypothetical protein
MGSPLEPELMLKAELGVEMDDTELSARVYMGRDIPTLKDVAAKFVINADIPHRCATQLFIKGLVPVTWLGAEVVASAGRELWLS